MVLLGTCISNLPIRPPPKHHHAHVYPISASDHHQTITKTPPKHHHAHAYPISPSDHHHTTTTTTTTKPPKTPPKPYYHHENTKARKWKKIPQINGKKFPKKIWTLLLKIIPKQLRRFWSGVINLYDVWSIGSWLRKTTKKNGCLGCRGFYFQFL